MKRRNILPKKSFSMFRGLPWAFPNTLKLVSAKKISFLAYEKYIFYHFKIFSTKKWLIW